MSRQSSSQRGASLVIALVMLVMITLLALSAMQLSQLDERNTRADRNQKIAMQAAEAALRDAWIDIDTGLRKALFSNAPVGFVDACSTDALPANAAAAATNKRGLCLAKEPTDARQIWQDVDFNARGVPFGTYTGRTWDTTLGQTPLYIIETVDFKIAGGAVQGTTTEPDQLAFRVTAVGFGPPGSRVEVALQSFYLRFK